MIFLNKNKWITISACWLESFSFTQMMNPNDLSKIKKLCQIIGIDIVISYITEFARSLFERSSRLADPLSDRRRSFQNTERYISKKVSKFSRYTLDYEDSKKIQRLVSFQNLPIEEYKSWRFNIQNLSCFSFRKMRVL